MVFARAAAARQRDSWRDELLEQRLRVGNAPRFQQLSPCVCRICCYGASRYSRMNDMLRARMLSPPIAVRRKIRDDVSQYAVCRAQHYAAVYFNAPVVILPLVCLLGRLRLRVDVARRRRSRHAPVDITARCWRYSVMLERAAAMTRGCFAYQEAQRQFNAANVRRCKIRQTRPRRCTFMLPRYARRGRCKCAARLLSALASLP